MANLNIKDIKIGISTDNTKNFQIYQPTEPDGSIRLGSFKTDGTILENLKHSNDGYTYGNTPNQFDNTKKLATTDFVQRSLGNYRGVVEINNILKTLTYADAGYLFNVSGSNNIVFLPLAINAPEGITYSFWNSGQMNIVSDTDDILTQGAVPTSGVTMNNPCNVTITKAGDTWLLSIGGAGYFYDDEVSKTGFNLQPSGLILQWGTKQYSGEGSTVTFSLTFPSYVRSVVPNALFDNGSVSVTSWTNSGFTFSSLSTNTSTGVTNNTSGTQSINWFAIGY